MGYIYGLLKAIITTLLFTMNKLVGNFGVAIILATIVIKIILLPLTLKQDKSMRNMKKLQPEIDKIKKQYKDNPQVMQQKTMELYKENKVSPFGGCLPLLVQLPILWALFGVLRDPNTVPVNETFLWMNLVAPDPYYILPVLNGIVSFLQQKLMGSAGGAQSKNMMYIFPVMMIVISYKMPAGLQIYWLASSLVSVIQQYFIMKRGD